MKPTIYLYIRGNCGNQFFQYAFARKVQEMYGGNLVINYYRVRHDPAAWPGSDNLLSDFNTQYKYECRYDKGLFIFKLFKFVQILLQFKEFGVRTYRFYLWCAKTLPKLGIYYFDSAYYPFVFHKRRNIYICGYFESPRYFENIDEKIKRELSPVCDVLEKNRDIYSSIVSRNSVCVTIKRMDVNNENIEGIYRYDNSYFYRAIEYMSEMVDNPLFCIFSDDIKWCRDNIRTDQDIWYETGDDTIAEKIRLMSACKHFIIHNSTFSWWVQHLSQNDNKIVIAPVKWMQRDDQPIDIYEKGWIYLTPKGQITHSHE